METIRYASLSDSQVMDFYHPGTAEKVPFILLIHGGAFLFGDQKMELIQPVIQAALTHGYAVASADYRKSKEAHFPGSLADIKACIRYVKAHAEELGIDSEKITVWGESAGAYLSLMTALTPEVKELNGDLTDNPEYSSCVKSLVTFYPPVEFYTMKAEYASWGDHEHGDGRFESLYLGVDDIYANEAACRRSYWQTYTDALPVDYRLSAWIQVGDENDVMVPYMQSMNFAERLALISGIHVHFEQIAGAKHEDPLFYTDENINRIFTWLESES